METFIEVNESWLQNLHLFQKKTNKENNSSHIGLLLLIFVVLCYFVVDDVVEVDVVHASWRLLFW